MPVNLEGKPIAQVFINATLIGGLIELQNRAQ